MDRAKVVVTGGRGRLGRYVVQHVGEVADVVILDVLDDGTGLPFDVLDRSSMAGALAGADAVIHLAAVPNPRTSTPDICFETNVMGTWNVLNASVDAGVRRVVVASSDAIVGLNFNPTDWMPQYLPIDIDHPNRPSEVYSLTKQITESICAMFTARGDIEVVLVRPTHIVFPSEWPELEARGGDVENYHLWSYVEPEEVADTLRQAVINEDCAGRVFYSCADDTLGELPTLEKVRKRWGCVPEIRDPTWFEDNPHASLFDTRPTRTELGVPCASDWRSLVARQEAVR